MQFGIRHRLRHIFRNLSGANRLARQALTLPSGQISLAEARFLGQLVSQLDQPGPIIEIGTLFGWSTRVMTLFKASDRELITVDNFSWNPLSLPSEQHFACTNTVLSEAAAEFNVRVVRQDKNDFYAAYRGMIPSLVFLDAIHTYDETQRDIEWARGAGAKLVCVHDYSEAHADVMRAVDRFGKPSKVVGSLALL